MSAYLLLADVSYDFIMMDITGLPLNSKHNQMSLQTQQKHPVRPFSLSYGFEPPEPAATAAGATAQALPRWSFQDPRTGPSPRRHLLPRCARQAVRHQEGERSAEENVDFVRLSLIGCYLSAFLPFTAFPSFVSVRPPSQGKGPVV